MLTAKKLVDSASKPNKNFEDLLSESASAQDEFKAEVAPKHING